LKLVKHVDRAGGYLPLAPQGKAMEQAAAAAARISHVNAQAQRHAGLG
jgi:hypothetical protein